MAESFRGGDFGDALRALRAGERVVRDGWDGTENMRLLLVQRCEIASTDDHGYVTKAGPPDGVPPFIAMHTAANTIVPWTPSQTDLLAHDWRAL